MADFTGQDLTGSSFRQVDLSDSVFTACGLHRVRLRGVEISHADITGELLDVRVNGVDVVPLVEAELDRRDPDRTAMRPTDADGFRRAWEVVERRWGPTVARAAALAERDPALLHASVEGEWSFVETLRHLVFATDAWVRRAILGDPSPWHPLDLPWDEMDDVAGVPRDRTVRPTLEEVLALRHDRMAGVRTLLDGLDDAGLGAATRPVEAPGWPPPRSFTVQECLSVVLNEEWQHRGYAERDLAELESGRG